MRLGYNIKVARGGPILENPSLINASAGNLSLERADGHSVSVNFGRFRNVIRRRDGACIAALRLSAPGCSRGPAALRSVRGLSSGPSWSRKVFLAKGERAPFR